MSNDLIYRQAAIDALDSIGSLDTDADREYARGIFNSLPSAQPTLYGYSIEHLALIAALLAKENLPPERVSDALNDIGRIIAIVREEYEEAMRKAVEQCMM